GGSGTFALWREGGGFLNVGGVAAGVGKDDGIFAGISEYVELVGAFATDGAVVGYDRSVVQAQTAEDIAVRLVHAVIGLLQRRLIHMEGVGVLHDEFAGPHQAEARADFVAELG